MCLCCGQQDLPNKSLQMWGFLCHEGAGARLELTLSSWELPWGWPGGEIPSRGAWQVFWEQ